APRRSPRWSGLRRTSTVEHDRVSPRPVLAVYLDGGKRVGDSPRSEARSDIDDGTFVPDEMIVDLRAGDDGDQLISTAREPSPEPYPHVDLLAGRKGAPGRGQHRLSGRDEQASLGDELEQ